MIRRAIKNKKTHMRVHAELQLTACKPQFAKWKKLRYRESEPLN